MNKIVALLVLLAAFDAAAQVTTVAGSLDLREQASAPTVRSNYGRLFPKTNGRLYYLKDDGTEYDVLSGGGGVMTGAEILDAINELTGALSLAEGCTTLDFGGGADSTGCTLDCATGELTCSVEIGGTMTAAEILAAIVTVDGAGSLFDADLLDGLSSSSFALVAGGNAFIASNTYAANDITDADVVDTITASNYVLLTDYEDSDVLTKVKAVDGIGSLLDADLLDGVSSAAFALVAGGNAFAASNTYAANDITDADVVDTITASNYVLLTDYEDSDVLTKVKAVDGAASGLDADLVDGVSSAAFALVAGGNAFAASNTYAANDITDADVVDTLTCSNYLPLGGGTLTGSVTGTNLTLSGSFDVQGVVRDTLSAYLEVDEGGVRTTGAFAVVTQSGGNVNIAPNNTTRFTIYNAGAVGVPSTAQQSITISTGDDTTSPTSSHVELACTTAPCTYKPGETSVVDGWFASVCNVDAADNIDLASAAGTVVVRGTPITLAPGACAHCIYSGAIWGCQ